MVLKQLIWSEQGSLYLVPVPFNYNTYVVREDALDTGWNALTYFLEIHLNSMFSIFALLFSFMLLLAVLNTPVLQAFPFGSEG
jgi:hypothetical protein